MSGLSLREENDMLREQVRQMHALLQPPLTFPFEWGLTLAEARILQCLVGAPDGRRSRDAIHVAASGQDPLSSPKVIEVRICKLRQKLAPLGFKISTLHGFGYRLDPAARAHILKKAGAGQ